MDSIQYQRDYYNQRWAQEAYANSLQAARCAAIIGELAQLELSEPLILDLGCGTGWLAAILSTWGRTTAVDLSDEAIQIASVKYPWVEFCSANILEWTPEPKLSSFDVVVSQEVIEHVEDQAGYLRVAHRLLGSGGHLILTTPNARTVAAMPEEQRHAWVRQPIENLLTVGELRRLVSDLFEIRVLRTIMPGYGVKGLYRVANSYKLWRVWAWLGCLAVSQAAWLRLGYGLHILVVARKN